MALPSSGLVLLLLCLFLALPRPLVSVQWCSCSPFHSLASLLKGAHTPLQRPRATPFVHACVCRLPPLHLTSLLLPRTAKIFREIITLWPPRPTSSPPSTSSHTRLVTDTVVRIDAPHARRQWHADTPLRALSHRTSRQTTETKSPTKARFGRAHVPQIRHW